MQMRSVLILGLMLFQAIVVPQSRAEDCFPPKHKLYCEFWTGIQLLTLPSAFMIYDPAAKTITTRAGNPLVTTVYRNVAVRQDLPPYYNHGLTAYVFGDAPLLSISEKQFDTIPVLAYLLHNHEATWGVAPGFETKLNNGLCFERPFFPENYRGW